jgi:hypothetical protein
MLRRYARRLPVDVSTAPSHEDLRFSRRTAVRIFALSALYQTVVILIVAQYVDRPFFPDAQLYDRYGRVISRAWHQSFHVFGANGLEHLSGTRAWGPHAFFGAVYYVFGESWLTACLALGVVAASGPVAIYVIASKILPSRRALYWTVAIVALYPTAVFWSAAGLKDGAVAALAFDVLALQLSLRAPWGTVAGVAGAAAFLTVRPVLAGSLLLAFLFSRGTQEGRFAKWLRVGAALAVIGLTVLPTGQRLAGGTAVFSGSPGASRYVVGNEGQVQIEGGIVAQIASAVSPDHLIQGLLSPRPWDFTSETASPYRWMYPGTALWILMLPAVCIGVALGLRSGVGPGRTLLIFVLVYAGAYYITFSTGFARQRTPLEMVGVVFAALALTERKEAVLRITSIWACVVAVVAVAEIDPYAGVLLIAAIGGFFVLRRRVGRGFALARG